VSHPRILILVIAVVIGNLALFLIFQTWRVSRLWAVLAAAIFALAAAGFVLDLMG
jgi:hypothetical protein